MSVRMRHTRGHTGNRRSHHALEAANIVVDKESGAFRLPHRIDETTGMYRGRQIAPAKAVRLSKAMVKGASTEPVAAHMHEHAHAAHANADVKAAEAPAKAAHSEAKHEAKKAPKGE